MKPILQTTFAKHQKRQRKTSAFKSAPLMAGLVFLAGLALSCGSLNIGVVQPLDLCQCTPLEPDIADYRHAQKHVPIAPTGPMGPSPLTIDTMYAWKVPPSPPIDPARTGVELIVFHITAAFMQEVSINGEDCDIHLEISQTASKTDRRVIVETPVDSEFCSARKNIQTQLAQHGVKLDPTHGGEILPQGLLADVVGMGFLDFDHTAVGLPPRGSAQVGTLWELHPATVNLLP